MNPTGRLSVRPISIEEARCLRLHYIGLATEQTDQASREHCDIASRELMVAIQAAADWRRAA